MFTGMVNIMFIWILTNISFVKRSYETGTYAYLWDYYTKHDAFECSQGLPRNMLTNLFKTMLCLQTWKIEGLHQWLKIYLFVKKKQWYMIVR